MDQPVTQRIHGKIQIIVCLQAEPELRRYSKVAPQTQGCISRDAAITQRDLINSARIHSNFDGEPILT